MFNTFLKPVHEHLDEQGYFAPMPDMDKHVSGEELSRRRRAIKAKLRIALLSALLAALVCAGVFWFATYLPFMSLYR